ncbi:MAG: tripartite tricarboxylate transporter substrate binding protein [Betaproteobacteria bacterium]|nr:tripartite tricarboxylate transporter substrate binding protein [Betaproteobacteria bacterium]
MMTQLLHRFFIAISIVVMASFFINPSHAQNYLSKTIRLVVPFTPGGSKDILARAIGQKITEAWGQAVVIENVPGAGGSLGADKVAKSPADGYTLLMGHIGTLVVTPSIYSSLPYHPIKSFSPVAWIAKVPNVLAVHPSVPANNFKELVAALQLKPNQFNYGSGGNGSAAHIAMEYFKLQGQTLIVHVPYRGTLPAVTDLVAGQIQLIFSGAPAVMSFVKSGQLKAIAVSSQKRLTSMPDVPTVAESGLASITNFEADQWYSIVAPAGTPPAIIQQLNTPINNSLNSPDLKSRLQAEGAQAMPTTPEALGKFIASEIERWRPVVIAGKVKAD